ncbi:hypothetical protein KC357_g3425 [Hortaea werneckii]|nr:hypothetical protein KC357_g3425 [Hortaea werneckii]
MPPNPVAARLAGNYAHFDLVVLCGNAVQTKGKANSLIARAPASGPRVSDKTAGELTEEGDNARAMAIVAGEDEQGLAIEEADVAMFTRKVNRELERRQQESQEYQDMAGVAKMRKACWKLLDKTHRLGEEDERDGLQHYGKDQSGIPLPTRLSGSDAFPTAELQEVMDDHERETWTMAEVFRRTKDLKKAVDEGKGFAKKIEELQREVINHKSAIAEQQTTISDQITTIGNLRQTNGELDREERQLRGELDHVKNELYRRAEKDDSSLRGVLRAILPVFDGRLADNLVCETLVKGVCRAKPAHATQTINPRAAPGYVWDVGLVLPEELASVELDESLPRRLWVKTCSTKEPRPSMVMVEACLLWFWRGRQYTPEDTRFMMAAAEMVVGHCRQASEAKDEAMVCLIARLALRIMELCLRSGVERSELVAAFWELKELTITPFCNRQDLLTCAMWDWVNSIVLLGERPQSVPETVLGLGRDEENDTVSDTVSDTDDPSSPRFMIASAGKSLLVDKAEGFVTELVEDEVNYTFMIPMGYRFTFAKGRRLRDNMDYRMPMLLGRDQFATFPYLVEHLPSVVDRHY